MTGMTAQPIYPHFPGTVPKNPQDRFKMWDYWLYGTNGEPMGNQWGSVFHEKRGAGSGHHGLAAYQFQGGAVLSWYRNESMARQMGRDIPVQSSTLAVVHWRTSRCLKLNLESLVAAVDAANAAALRIQIAHAEHSGFLVGYPDTVRQRFLSHAQQWMETTWLSETRQDQYTCVSTA